MKQKLVLSALYFSVFSDMALGLFFARRPIDFLFATIWLFLSVAYSYAILKGKKMNKELVLCVFSIICNSAVYALTLHLLGKAKYFLLPVVLLNVIISAWHISDKVEERGGEDVH